MVDHRRDLGARGEALVAAWYEARGCSVVDRNWRVREGEIDLVVADGSSIVFCEVKTRTTDLFGSPAAAVTPVKQRRLRVLAAKWLAASGRPPCPVRFDVASVIGGAVEVIVGAF